MATITLDSVTKQFGDEMAIENLSLTIQEGEVLGVVGPSGCGKTTTLRTIAGFETPTNGEVLFDGADVTAVPPEKRNVGLVFQSYALFENMSVLGNVAFGPKMQGVSKKERRDRALELLEMLDIEQLADKDPTNLSGGQQQRVGLARALAVEPDILLLDEPMTGLDAKLKERLQHEIGSLLSELGVTAMYVTHDQEEAMVMCDRIAVLNDGAVEQVGTPAAVYECPATEFVADFVGTSNLLPATARDGVLDLGFATVEIDLPEGVAGEVTVNARPADFQVGEGPLEVVVEDVDYLGDARRITGSLPDGQSLTLESEGGLGTLKDGATLSVDLDPSGVHVIDGGADGTVRVD